MVGVNLAVDSGLVNTYSIAFTIMVWAMLADFLLGFINALFNKTKKVKSKRMGDTVLKMTSVFFTFFTMVIISLLTYENSSFHLLHITLHWAVIFLSILVITREIISLLETAEDMGLPGAAKIKERIDGLPNLFEKGGKENE